MTEEVEDKSPAKDTEVQVEAGNGKSYLNEVLAGEKVTPGNQDLQMDDSHNRHYQEQHSKELKSNQRSPSDATKKNKHKRCPRCKSPLSSTSRPSRASTRARSSSASNRRRRDSSSNSGREMSKSSNLHESRKRCPSTSASMSLSRSNDGSRRRCPSSTSTSRNRSRTRDGSSPSTRNRQRPDSSERAKDDERKSSSPLRRARTDESPAKRRNHSASPLRRVKTDVCNHQEMEDSSRRHQMHARNPSSSNNKQRNKRSKSPKRSLSPSKSGSAGRDRDETKLDGSANSSMKARRHKIPNSRHLPQQTKTDEKRLQDAAAGGGVAGTDFPARPGPTSLQRAVSEGHQTSSLPTRHQRVSEGHASPIQPRQRASEGCALPTRQNRVSKRHASPSQRKRVSEGHRSPTRQQRASEGHASPTRPRQRVSESCAPPTREKPVTEGSHASPTEIKFNWHEPGTDEQGDSLPFEKSEDNSSLSDKVCSRGGVPMPSKLGRTSTDGSAACSKKENRPKSQNSHAPPQRTKPDEKRLQDAAAVAGTECPAKPAPTSLQRAVSEGHQTSSPTQQQRVSEGHAPPSQPRQRVSEGCTLPARQKRVSKGHTSPAQRKRVSEGHRRSSPTRQQRTSEGHPSPQRTRKHDALSSGHRHKHHHNRIDGCGAKMRDNVKEEKHEGQNNNDNALTHKCRSRRHKNAHATSVLHAQVERGVAHQDQLQVEEWIAQQEHEREQNLQQHQLLKEETVHVEEEFVGQEHSRRVSLGMGLLNLPLAAATMAPKLVTGTAVVAAKTTVAATATASAAAATTAQAVGSGALATASTAAHVAAKTTVAATSTASAAATITAQAVGSSALATASTAANVITGAANVALNLVPFSLTEQQEHHEGVISHQANTQNSALRGHGLVVGPQID